MKPLNVEFASKRPVSRVLLGALAVALCLLALREASQAWELRQQIASTDSEISKLTLELERVQQAKRIAASQASAEPPYARDALAVARVAAFPLDRVLTSLEGARVQGVRLTALEIAATDGTVRADLEFTDHEALMRYLEDINAGEERPRWKLVQAQSASAGTGMSTATIRSTWDAGR